MKIKVLHLLILLLWVVILVSSYIYYLPKINFLGAQFNKFTDILINYRYKHSQPPQVINDFVLVNIDDETLEKLNNGLPVTRALYLEFLLKLASYRRPRIIGLQDMAFINNNDGGQDDITLAQAMKEFQNIVITNYFTESGLLMQPPQIFIDSALDAGFANFPLDKDMTIRRVYPFIHSYPDNTFKYSFALKIFCRLRDFNAKNFTYDRGERLIKLLSVLPGSGDLSIPLDDKSDTTPVNFFAKSKDFKSIPLWRIIESWEPPETLGNKILLVGSSMGLFINRQTPLGPMPDSCLNANFIMSLLLHRFLKPFPINNFFFILLGIALLTSIVTLQFGSLRGFLLNIFIVACSFYISVVLISQDIIFDFYGIFIISTISFVTTTSFKYLSVVFENTSLRRLSITDGLTGLYVFRYFELKLNSEIRKALNANKELSLIIFDIDHFKNINDTYGHDAGNELLKNIALIMNEHSRPTDVVSRFGGEEFAVILPQTSMEGAAVYAQSIRKLIEEFTINHQNKSIKVTISGGISSINTIGKKNYINLIKSADSALYEAKSSGRNKIVCASQA